MPADARFWDRTAARYAKAEIGNPEAYEHKLALTRELFGPDTEVLEVGCGTGSTALLHAPHVRRILATDFSPVMIGIARDRAAAEGAANVEFEVAAVEEIAARGEQFDVVLALNLLHLVDDLDAALRNITAVLRPGGALVASTACIGDTLPFMRYLLPPARWLGLVPSVGIFGEEALVDAFERAGLAVEMRFQPDKGRAPAVFHIARLQG